ncbi:MAG: DUF3021 domain-containing protein [Oscillospiraceae bacterium]|nr:DUF3021 domain-containing protein [Oscillospiraceae bacterium]
MKKNVKDFVVRGMMYAWGGPCIMALVWAALQRTGEISGLTVNEAVLGIFSMTIMAFIAAGATTVYQIETLPKTFAGLIHAVVLYLDYLGFYLLNGWFPVYRILTFTLIFALCFFVIWLCIYLGIKAKVNKMNQVINEN